MFTWRYYCEYSMTRKEFGDPVLTRFCPDIWQNTVHAKKVAALGLTHEECKETSRLSGEADMTDFENFHFVYPF
jgi:hypothetical protein